MTPTLLVRLLQADAAVNTAGGLAIVTAMGPMANAIGLEPRWPIAVAAAVLVAYGAENWLVARRPSRAGVTGLATVDLVFGVVVGAWALVDPAGMAAWLRWTLVVVADLSVVVGILKLVGMRSLAPVAVGRGVHA